MAWERYTSDLTSFEVQVRTGGRWIPRFYCDDNSFAALPDAVKPYLRKAPVCKLSVTPPVVVISTSQTWDVSQSTSPTTSLDTFDVLFNGSPTDKTAQDWSVDPKSGSITYAALGEYIVEATVTDQLGVKSQTASVRLLVVPAPSNRVLVATTDAGVFVIPVGGPPAASNTGLSGTHLNVRSLRLHPAYADLPAAQQHVWLATEGGLAYSTDGGASWTAIDKADLGTPANDAGDSPAPVTADLDQIDLNFDPQAADTITVLRTTATRTWVYKSVDYGATWSNEQVGV